MNLTRSRRRGHDRPVALSREHRAEIDARRVGALRHVAPNSAVARRIATAPPSYLLAHTGSDIARQCELLAPSPAPGAVRVAVTPGRTPGTWHLDIGTRDRAGLLACFTGVLVGAAIDVVQAVVATWADGGALQALVVRGDTAPDPVVLQRGFAAALERPLTSFPTDGVEIGFDQTMSPVFTACEVTAPDHPGLLHAVATALAATGTDIHAASVATVDGVARDRFDLTDRDGRKIDADRQRQIRDTLRVGVRNAPAR